VPIFNLIVSGSVDNDRKGSILASRVLQYTDDELVALYKPSDVLDIEAVKALPTLLMEEGRGDEIVRMAWLSRIVRSGANYELTYAIDPNMPKLTNADIVTLADEFHMHDWEFRTNHWAVKDVDLFQVLLAHQSDQSPKPSVFQLSEKPVNPQLISMMMPFSPSFGLVHSTVKAAVEAEG